MSRVVTALLAAGVLLSACFGGDDGNVTESGKGLPVVSIDMPAGVRSGSTQEMELTVSNPGPGDMRVIVVAFAAVGPIQGQRELPTPLLGVGGSGETVLSVSPEPRAVSQDGAVYTFDGLDEGDERTITFRLRIPEIEGVAANSVQVYDGQEVDRAAGDRLETTVER